MTRWLPLQAEAIPHDLRSLGWVLWRAEPRADDKPAKVPYRVSEPTRRASSTDPSTWAIFADAVAAFRLLADVSADANVLPLFASRARRTTL